MSEKKKEAKNWISFRVKPEEYKIIHEKFEKTSCRKLSEYARKVLLNNPVIIKYRNQSADNFLAEIVQLKNELNHIGNNFNQAVKKLHTIDTVPEIKSWLLVNEVVKKNFMEKVEEIKNYMTELYDLWSQK